MRVDTQKTGVFLGVNPPKNQQKPRQKPTLNQTAFYSLITRFAMCLQCFDAVGGAAEGHPARKNLSDEVLAWLSVWSEVQRLAYGPADTTANHHLCFRKFRMVSFWY